MIYLLALLVLFICGCMLFNSGPEPKKRRVNNYSRDPRWFNPHADELNRKYYANLRRKHMRRRRKQLGYVLWKN